jgi:hypothetical protein
MVDDMAVCMIQISNGLNNCNLPSRFESMFIPRSDI